MIEQFIEISPNEMGENAISLIGKEWMLITAGQEGNFNTMTASWGGLGYLWKLPVAFIFVRPQRFTYQFTENFPNFSLSFFDKKDRKILNYCGENSGRDVDKIKETGLSAFKSPSGNILFQQARMQIECTKIYSDDIRQSNFIIPAIDQKIYPQKDYHRFYIGKINHIWKRK